MILVQQMPRRATREEEDRLLKAAQRVESAGRAHAERQRELDLTMLEIRRAGARPQDIIDILGLTRGRYNAAIDRAEALLKGKQGAEADNGPEAA